MKKLLLRLSWLVVVAEVFSVTIASADSAPPSANVPAAIAAMPEGTWLNYGRPWDNAAPDVIPCGKRFGTILSAWNGWARNGLRYIYVAASGGHGDGCDNGVYRYDIQTGRPELYVPHVALNAGFDDDSNKPFVANDNGVQILPRSSHTYQGQYLDGEWLYLITGSVYQRGNGDGQVWRFHTVEKRWERLPDRRLMNGKILGTVAPLALNTPDGTVFIGGRNICDAELVSGTYDCQNDLIFSVRSSVAWDPIRQGVWHLEPRIPWARFLRRVDGVWQIDESLSGAIPEDVGADLSSHPGLCIVPDGRVLVWANSSNLHQWDGASWTTITPASGPPHNKKRRVNSKWSWDDEARACIGGSATKEGLWIYKPESYQGADPAKPAEQTSEPEPARKPAAEAGVSKWHIDRDNLPSVGGVPVSVAAWQAAPWDQTIERLAGAPDYDAICNGQWAELHYRTNADLAGSRQETENLGRNGVQNVRVYLHPLLNAEGTVVPYTEGIRGRAQCLEVIGVPLDGQKPQLKANIGVDTARGLIVRGVYIAQNGNECVAGKGPRVDDRTQLDFVVIHDSEFYGCGGHTHFFGAGALRHHPQTYVEMIGNVSGYARSHTFYIERSVGRMVYKSNVCFAPGWGHCFKNLAHSSLIEGNVFSNAGLRGEVVSRENSALGRPHRGGMHPLDLYGCTETEVRNNTIIFRTTNSIRNIIAYRARGAWGGCHKGRRLDAVHWEYLPPTSPAYHEPAFWQEVAAAKPLFDEGPEAARASKMLFTHQAEGNRFIVIPAFKGRTNVTMATLKSLRPVVKNKLALALKAEATAVFESCAGDAVCYYDKASDGLKYAYDHLPDSWRREMVVRGETPAKIPIPVPEGWAERYAVYWGAQDAWMCDPDGSNCAPWDAPVPRMPVENLGWDDVRQEHPPRVILGE